MTASDLVASVVLLRNADQRDWSAFHLLPDAVTVWDRALRCRYANPAAVRLLDGAAPEQLTGRSMRELLPAQMCLVLLEHARSALAGQAQQEQLSDTDGAGRVRHTQVSCAAWHSAGRVAGVVVTFTDITAAIQAQNVRLAAEATDVVRRPLSAAVLELSATLQDGAGIPHDRVREAIKDIDAAGEELRSLLVGASGAPRTAEIVAANVGDAVVVADAQGRYEWASPSSALVTGWHPDDLVGRSTFELVHPDDEPLLHARWAEQVAGAPLVGVEYRRRRPDGSYHWVESRIRPLHGRGGRVSGSIASIRDVSDRHRLQEELAEALETFELSFAAAPIGKGLVDADGRWLKVNPALCGITGRTRAELLNSTYRDITHPDDLDVNVRLAGEMLRGERTHCEFEKRYLRPDGREVWVLLSVAAARRPDGSFRFFVVQVQDISRRKADAEALQHRADHDPLTGLWNRRRLTDALTACYRGSRRATDRPLLLLLDLDGFKAVNDCFGHAAGDVHLRDVAGVLRDSIRAGDGCARLGGDEFAVLLADADADTATDIAERIADRVRAFGRGTVSIGTATWRADQDVDAWLQAADRAMYEAKAGHRGAVAPR